MLCLPVGNSEPGAEGKIRASEATSARAPSPANTTRVTSMNTTLYCCNLCNLPYERIERPIWPLDPLPEGVREVITVGPPEA